jgi:hypothetical protein
MTTQWVRKGLSVLMFCVWLAHVSAVLFWNAQLGSNELIAWGVVLAMAVMVWPAETQVGER